MGWQRAENVLMQKLVGEGTKKGSTPLYAATLVSEWSLVRSRSHYPSDVFAGAALGWPWPWWRGNSGRRCGQMPTTMMSRPERYRRSRLSDPFGCMPTTLGRPS